MSKPNTTPVISNTHPNAAVVFIPMDGTGKPVKDAQYIIVPDIADLMDISCTLGSTGKTGQFSLKISNKNDKYFYADDIQKEIANLAANKIARFEKLSQQPDKAAADRDVIYEPAKVAWSSVVEFLNKEQFNKIYIPATESANQRGEFIYLLERESNDPTSADYRKLKYRELPKSLATSQKFEDTMANVNLKEASLDSAEAAKILDKAKTNAAFYTDLGGQREHGRCVFEPMQICMILTTRRFVETGDPDDLVVTFTGIVDAVTDMFDGTTNVLHISGSDVTKWMRITLTNVNPSLFQDRMPGGGSFKLWDKKFAGLQGWQIILLLTTGGIGPEGDIEFGSGYFQAFPEITSGESSTTQQRDRSQQVSVQLITRGLSSGPTEIVTEPGQPLPLPSKLNDLFYTPSQVHVQVLPWDSSPDSFTNEAALRVYQRIWGASFGNWQNEYADSFDLANEVARLTNFEFYADQYGDIWYHQPRFNNYHILTADNPEIWTFQDEHIVSSTFTESDVDVLTSVYCTGIADYLSIPEQIIDFSGFYEDASLVKQYGRRMEVISHPYISTHDDCYYFAKSYMQRRNASRFTGTVTILGRPELRVHRPVYIPMRNMIYTISEISHEFTFGGQFLTTVKLTYGHKPWEVIPELLDYNIPPSATAKSTPRPTTAAAPSTTTSNTQPPPQEVVPVSTPAPKSSIIIRTVE